MIGRLVEQQQVGAAHQRLREIEAHPPAAGKARHRIALARRRKAQAGSSVAARARAASRRSPRSDGAARPAARRRHADRFPRWFRRPPARARRRATPCRRRARSRSPAPRPPGVSCATCAIVHAGGNSTVPGVGDELAADQREQARLAAAVGADQPDLVAGMDREVGAVEQALCAAGEREIGYAQHLFTATRSRSR